MRKGVQTFPSKDSIHLTASSAASDLLIELHRINIVCRINIVLPCRNDLARLLMSPQLLKTLPMGITPTYPNILERTEHVLVQQQP